MVLRERKMETIEYFSDFLGKIGSINFLAIGIVIVVIWLLISGLRRGLRKGGRSKRSEHDDDA
jgi:hypothetical protein